jgi:hypothetical protein
MKLRLLLSVAQLERMIRADATVKPSFAMSDMVGCTLTSPFKWLQQPQFRAEGCGGPMPFNYAYRVCVLAR